MTLGLIGEKEYSVIDTAGIERSFLLSKFPAVQGREIIAKYPTTAIPKIGDYDLNEETMLKLMAFVAVVKDGVPMLLSTKALINNHVGDWETLTKIEMAMMEYNCSFFQNGNLSNFLTGFIQTTMVKISEILTGSLAQSSPTEKQP